MSASSPEKAIKDKLANKDFKGIYSLSKEMNWSYGKTERRVNKLLKSGEIFSSIDIENGRTVRILSLEPVEEDKINVLNPADDNEISYSDNFSLFKRAFKHLYGVFLELKAAPKIDPTVGLLNYCKAHPEVEMDMLLKLLDDAWKHVRETNNE